MTLTLFCIPVSKDSWQSPEASIPWRFHCRIIFRRIFPLALRDAILKVDEPYAHALSCLWGMPVHWTTVDNWTNHSPPYISSIPDIKRHQVHQTDLLLFASDGLRAAFGTSSIELGKVISRIVGESSDSGLASRIMDEARQCAQGKLVDDVSILVFRVGKV